MPACTDYYNLPLLAFMMYMIVNTENQVSVGK